MTIRQCVAYHNHLHGTSDKHVMALARTYYLKNNYLTLRYHEGDYGMRHTALWSCIHIPNKYYLKNNYLTLRSKVKVPRRLFRYTTHRLMVMHPHTKYHWPISKDKNVMAWTRKYYLKNNYVGAWPSGGVSHTVMTFMGPWPLTSRSNNCFLNSIYLVCGCMTIRQCVAYRNDLRGTLTSRSNNCFLNSIFLSGP
jgi:hypothetical protein